MFTIGKSKKSPVKSLFPGDEDNSVNHKGLIKRNLNNDEFENNWNNKIILFEQEQN